MSSQQCSSAIEIIELAICSINYETLLLPCFTEVCLDRLESYNRVRQEGANINFRKQEVLKLTLYTGY